MRKYYTLSVLLVVYVLLIRPAYSQNISASQHNDTDSFDPAFFQDLKWRNIGPFRGGRANAIIGIRGNDQVYYLGTVGGGVWKTTDGGTTWQNISDGYFSTSSIGAITVAPTDPDIIYVGTGEHAVRGVMSNYGNGVYKSTDGGKTWRHIGLAGTRHISRIAVHPYHSDVVLVAAQGAAFGAGTERGIFLSTDGGESWEKTLYINETTGASEVCMDPSNPDVVYASTWDHERTPWSIRSGGPGSGLFKSTDGGRTWLPLTEGLPEKMGKTSITLSPANPTVLYAVIEAEEGGVFRSNDGGLSWTKTSGDRATIARAWYYTEIVADPVDEQTVYVLNAPLLKSIDGGETFFTLNDPHTDQHDLWINPANPKNLALANDGGGSISFTGGETWSSQRNQPTAQLYRVIADRQFPYHVYAGQQDYSTIAVPSRSRGAGIAPSQSFEVGGGESAFITFDPERPQLIYGSSYQGSITVFDRITQQIKEITAYPTLGIAATPRKQFYRFNWNAPVVANAIDPSIIYHAGNKVLETRDGGYNWREISPDLTRDEEEKQGKGGGPFTNEGAGGEVYNTISYLASSPHNKHVLWVGTDDGLLHITRSGGQEWNNVTPPQLNEATINCIEISPHDSNTVYVVAMRHKFNDFSPLIFRTRNQGRTWQKITDGIPKNDFVRVVRSDTRRPSLLYAGTQSGFYISTNAGDSWYRFQSNLPVTPITDMAIADNDLVVSTSGRGFWILDDLAPLQQTGGVFPDNEVALIYPDDGYRFAMDAPDYAQMPTGTNPPPGIIIDYFLPPLPDTSEVELAIYRNGSDLVRAYSSSSPSEEEGEAQAGLVNEPVLPIKPGHNRFNWDVRREPLPAIKDAYVHGDYRGGMVSPGKYLLELRTPVDTVESKVELKADPRLSVPEEAYAEQEAILKKIEDDIREMHTSIQKMSKTRRQIESLLHLLEGRPEYADLTKAGEVAIERINTWEKDLIQRKQKTPQDAINYENKLSAEYMALKDAADSHNPRVTSGIYLRYNDLSAEWRTSRKKMDQIIQKEITSFNRIFESRNLPALIAPDVKTYDD